MQARFLLFILVLSMMSWLNRAHADSAVKAPADLRATSSRALRPALSTREPRPAASAREAHFMERVIELTNQERAKVGAPPLKREESLTASARWLAQDMVANKYFAHADKQGRHIDTRLPDFGYTDYSALGENIAAGQQTPEEVVTAWLESPGHRANLLNPDFREIGLAYVNAPNSEYQHYWVQDFGARRDVYPLIINNDVNQAKSAAVQLYAHGDKWARRARYSSDGVHWTTWEPFQPMRAWTLDTTQTRQTVYVELNNGKDIRRASASIELNDTTRVASANSAQGLQAH